MASLAAIIAAQAEQDQQAAQAETELKLQRAHASVLESGSSEEADLALALLLSKQEAEKESGVRVASAIPLPFDHTYAPASTPRDGPEDDYALAMRLQSEEDAAASLSRSAPASKLRSRHRHEVVRLDSTAFGCPAGQWDGEDPDDDAVVDAQVEEEEAQFAALVGTMGHRSRGAGRSAWTTKHDARLTGRRNARRLEHQHPTVGDLTGRGTKLSNRVAGDLTRHFSKQTRKGVARSGRVEGATVQTQEGVMDERTRLLLFKLCNTVLGEVHGVVKTGKESSVYTATGWDPTDATLAVPSESSLKEGPVGPRASGFPSATVLPVTEADATSRPFSVAPVGPNAMVALKIFRSTLNEFKNRTDYVSGDHRYKKATSGRSLARQNPRKVVKLWAEKEWANLLREAKLPSTKAWATAYTQVVRIMIGMYHRCKLVHADLSEYNLLWFDRRVFVIDTAQAVEATHPNATNFLERDAANITRFFDSKGVQVLSAASLVHFIQGAGEGSADGSQHQVYQSAQGKTPAHPSAGAGEAPAPATAAAVFGSKHDPVVQQLKELMEAGVVDAAGEGAAMSDPPDSGLALRSSEPSEGLASAVEAGGSSLQGTGGAAAQEVE